jgi:enolase-phosphatase E1
MKKSTIKFILSDIEGTTSSISFVVDVLFPYFLENSHKLLNIPNNPIVLQAFEETKMIVKSEVNKEITSLIEAVEFWNLWCKIDRKITPLKSVQGLIWEEGFKSGIIKGHVYSDVRRNFEEWTKDKIQLGIFSSGSISAQRLLFGHSIVGDLTIFLSAYFDTTSGGKKEVSTYSKIVSELNLDSKEICFLSDVKEELKAAESCGMLTIQLVRENTIQSWKNVAKDFDDVNNILSQI